MLAEFEVCKIRSVDCPSLRWEKQLQRDIFIFLKNLSSWIDLLSVAGSLRFLICWGKRLRVGSLLAKLI